MESDSETFYSLPGSGRKLRVPIKVKRGKVVSPSGVNEFDFDEDCPDDERMALRPTPSYMSEEGEETVLLEGNEDEAELEAKRIRREMEDDEATHFTEGLGEEIILPEDSDDEEVNALADELGGLFLPDSGDMKSVDGIPHSETGTSEEEKKEEDSADFEPIQRGIDADGEAPMDSSEAEVAGEAEVSEVVETKEVEAAETVDNEYQDIAYEVRPQELKSVDAADDLDIAAEDDAEEPNPVLEKKEDGSGEVDPVIVATTATEESEEAGMDEPTNTEEAEIDPDMKIDPEGKSLACSTNTTEETQETGDQQAADAEPKAQSQAELETDAASSVGAPGDEEQTDTEEAKKVADPPGSTKGIPQSDVDDASSSTDVPRDELTFLPAVGSASDTDYVTASDTDYQTATDYATTDYGTETDYGTTDYATSFDYDTETTREVDDSRSVNQSVTHSVANSIAADGKGSRKRKSEKERSKWSLFGCGIVEEVPSTKQEWWNFVLDSTEGALQTVGGSHWDDPWAAAEDGEEFDDDFDAYLNHNRSNRPRRRTRSVSTTRVGNRKVAAARSRRYRRASSAPRTRTTLPKQDRRKQLV
ncbi:MAG: hypothetical protein SGBAC_003722 [Bacillariaceae sp.]